MTAYNQTNPINYINALHRETEGYITLFRKLPDGNVRQYHYKLDAINDDMLHEWITYDSYVSLNSFYRTKRGNDTLRTIHNLYVDIDCYNVGMSAEQVLYTLEQDYYGQSIPTPNLVLQSGRGIGLIWHIEPISGLAIERWSIVQRAICDRLKEFGADANALDAARIFRLPASINSKSNEIVRYDMLHNHEYSLPDVAKEYFGIIPIPKSRRKAQNRPQQRKKKKTGVYNLFSPYSLNKARLEDLECLIKMRDGEMRGHRERILFLARYYALKVTENEQAAISKIEYLNGLFVEPLKPGELLVATKSAVTYFKDAGINISNAKLIEWLQITLEEQQALSTIISKGEKLERARMSKEKARRACGKQSRLQYLAQQRKQLVRTAKRVKLCMSIYPNHSTRELAERLGMSKTHVANLLKRLSELLVENIEQVATGASFYIKGGSLPSVVSGLGGLLAQDLVDTLQRLDRSLHTLRVT